LIINKIIINKNDADDNIHFPGDVPENIRKNYNPINSETMKTMNPVVHFEMPAEDRNRMADFYTSVFGWQAQLMGEEMGN
jgi:hypothetical protein